MSRKDVPPLDVDYARYERLKSDGEAADAMCGIARADGKDFAFQIRMLRSVFGMDLAVARDTVARVLSSSCYTERLFSYGTLQLPDVQRATFGRLLNGTPDDLVGFAQEMVEITDPDVLATSGQRFHPIVRQTSNPTDRVAGVVFEITSAELASSDEYEVDDYARVEAQLASGLTAWVYVQRA